MVCHRLAPKETAEQRKRERAIEESDFGRDRRRPFLGKEERLEGANQAKEVEHGIVILGSVRRV